MDKKGPGIRSRVQSDAPKLNVKYFVSTTRGQYYPTKCLHSKVPSPKLNRRLQLTTRVSHLCQWLEFAYKQQFCLQCRRLGFDSWVGKIPWRKKWQPTPVFLPGEFHGQRKLSGLQSGGSQESDMTEQLNYYSPMEQFILYLRFFREWQILLLLLLLIETALDILQLLSGIIRWQPKGGIVFD